MVNCQECHYKCHADCCRTFTISPKQLASAKNGVVTINKHFGIDDRKYYELHGAKVVHGLLRIRLSDYRIQNDGGVVVLWRDCNNLTEELLCRDHENKPLVCNALTESTAMEGRFYLTTGCRFTK